VLDLRHSMTSLDRKLASAVAYLAGIERANNARLSGLDGLLNSCTLGMHERTYRRVLYHGDDLPCQGEKSKTDSRGQGGGRSEQRKALVFHSHVVGISAKLLQSARP
jgi:hypothetical protein